MSSRSWRRFVRSLLTPSPKTIGNRAGRLDYRPRLEWLEGRIAPATNITVIQGALGSGTLDHFLSASNGTITVADDPGDLAATLSTAALQQVGAGVNISISADSQILFNNIGTLNLQSGPGGSASFTTASGSISFATISNTLTTAGAALNFAAGLSLTVANLNTNGGDVALAAGASAAGNLTAHTILTAGSGNITFTDNSGSITQSGTAAGQAISATASGNVSVDSLRGTSVSVTSSNGSVTSFGASPIQGSAEVTLTAATGINVFILTPSVRATNNVSGNVIITQLPPPNQDLTIVGSGVNNLAAGGIISITNSAGNLSLGTSMVTTNNGTIFLSGTGLDLASGTVNSGTAATELHNSVAGLGFDLGHKVVGKIGLTQADLNAITAGVVRIGTTSAGSINVSAAITNPATWNTLALIANGPITEAAAGTLTLPNLRVSGAGPVTLLSVNDVQTLGANTTNSFSFNNGTNFLSIGVVDGDTGIVTTHSDIVLIADNMNIAQQVSTGSTTLPGIVTLQPFTSTETIDLGTNSANNLGLTDTELNEVTAGVLRIGGAFGGNIIISAAINPAHIGALSLVTTGSGTITQGSGDTISVASGNGGLAIQAAKDTALNEQNDVGALAVAITGDSGFPIFMPNNFSYTDATGFKITTVDGIGGISVSPGGIITLTAGGAVTQDAASADALSDEALLLLGTGPFTLNNTSNSTTILAASVTNAVTYVNAGALEIGSIRAPDGVTIIHGVNTTDATIDIETVNGDLTVFDNVHSGTAEFDLTAGGTESTLTNSANSNSASLTGGNAVLSANRMSLANGPINVGTGIVTLRPFSSGRTIDLGGTGDPTGTLQISQAELNTITAGIVRVGDLSTSGSITITAALTDATTGFNTLSLLTEVGSGISQNNGATLTFTNLQAAGNTGVALNQNNVVSFLSGATESGAFSFVDSTNLTVDNTDAGLGFGFGSGIITDGQAVNLTVNVLNDSLAVNQTIDTTHSFGSPASGGANINLSADNMALNNNSPSSTINAGTGGTLVLTPFTLSNTILVGGPDAAGALGIDDNDLSNVTANHVDIGGGNQTGAISIDGSITRHAGFDTLQLFANGGGGAITQITGSISVANLTLQANAGIGAAGAIQVVGPINVRFDAANGSVQISATGALTIAPVFGLASSSAGTTTLTASGPIAFAASTTSSGTITATTTETASETTTPLPEPDDDISVNTGVTVESTGGDVNFTSADSIVTAAGSLIKSDSGTIGLTAGQGDNDNDATLDLGGSLSGASITISAPGDICVSGITATGTVSITSTNGAILDCADTGDTEPTSPTGDFSNGASADITASTLNLSASTGIGITSGMGVGPLETQVSNLEAHTATGGIFITNGVTSAVTLNVVGNGFGPPDGVVATTSGDIQLINQGSINIVTANDVVRSPGNIFVQAFGATANIQTGAQSSFNAIRSTGAGTVNVIAGQDILMGNATSFGSIVSANGSTMVTAGRDLIIDFDSRLSVDGGSGNVTATAGRNITLQQTGGTTGARVTNDGSGSVSLTTGAGGIFTLNSGAGGTVYSTGGNITVSADDMVISDPIDASNGGTAATPGIVTLAPFTAGRPIDLGLGTTSGALGLSAAEVNQVTASALLVGGTGNAGDITVTSSVTPAGTNQLELLSGGAIFNSSSANVLTVARVAFIAVNGIGEIGPDMQIHAGNLEALNTGAHSIFIDNTGPVLTIGGVDSNLHGVQVTGLAGGIFLSNNNTIDINLRGEIVRAPGSVLVFANGGASNILTGGFNGEDTGAVVSTGATSTVTLSAGQDLVLGDTSNGSNGDIFSFGQIVLGAGRDILDDEGTFIESKGVGAAGTIHATAGRNISILSTGGVEDAYFSSASGAITLTTGAGGTFTADSLPIPFGNGDASVFSNDSDISSNPTPGGDIIINADHVIISSSDLIRAGAGVVTIQQVTGSEAIQLGTVTDGELDLSNAELAAISGTTLKIGNTANTGSITVNAAVSTPNVTALSLLTGGGVTQNVGDTLTMSNLAIRALNAVTLNAANSVGKLAANVTGANQAFSFIDAGSLTIGTVDGLVGVTTNGGAITITAGTDLTVNNNVAGGSGAVNLKSGANNAGSNFRINAAMSGSSVHVNGGTGADDFIFGAGVTLSGAIDGGLGSDTIDWSAYTGPVTVTVTALGTQDGFKGNETASGSTFDDINTIIGPVGQQNVFKDGIVPPGSYDGVTYTNSGRTLTLVNFVPVIPANNVTLSFAAGILTITGDSNANSIVITQVAANQITVRRGAIGTTFTFNGQSGLIGPITVNNVTGLHINMNAGNDSVQFDCNSHSISLTGGISITGGTGNRKIFETAAAGNFLTTGHSLAITSGAGTDTFTFTNLHVGGSATLQRTGAGDSNISFGTSDASLVDRINSSLTIANGAGYDSTSLANLQVGGATHITFGTPLGVVPGKSDLLDIQGSTFGGLFAFTGGNIATTANLQTATGETDFHGTVSMLFGSGNDTFTMATGGIVRLTSTSVFLGGHGTNTLVKNDANILFNTTPLFQNWN